MSETERLGRGLEALLGSVTREQAQASGALLSYRSITWFRTPTAAHQD